MLRVTFSLVFFVAYILNTCYCRHGEFISSEDRAYEDINIKIPKAIWKKALRPTPVLKSPVTIVVPIHVADNEDEIEDELDNEVVDEADVPIESVPSEEPILNEPVTSVAPVAVTTPVPVQDVVPESPVQDVNGTVIRFPCNCRSGQCGCCTGAILQRLKMKTCGNISFIPEDFVFDVRLSVNNNTVIRRRVSASDPPPICINPRRAPFVRVCAEISNIRIRNGNAFACLDINADIAGFTIYSASFRCFGLGSSGVQTGLKPKPVSSGPSPINLFGNGNNEQGGTILDAASALLGGNRAPDGGGIFGGGSDGPLDAIGDAIGDFFDGRHFDKI